MTATAIHITIDGREVQVPEGLTLLEALERHGKTVPVICLHEATTPEGVCRQCVVEVEGWRTLAPACVTRVSDGMAVFSESERVRRARRTILEMLAASVDLSEAPEIREQMQAYRAEAGRFPDAELRQPALLDDNPFYLRDYSKCILCWRCVQACGDDLQFTYALSAGGRGYESRIATFFDAPLPETTCVFCGNCVAVCPSGALKGKTEHFLEQGLDYDQVRAEKARGRRGRKKRGKPDA